ncbi:prealbumin-like fold domain-containing protein [Corynebacterium glutamicum]|uniref:prealbumin-like fold domain-containing protein n=1 Tax=Corynebacterium glutamicum TaxID=1718 RepID=UPI0014676A41|nr:prealbumin-like fold domain-containing protein [Corynebacterium glutamicum]GFK17612.1 hypothetical protein KbCgl_01840 [Corynebacterium glutamicum]
MFRHPVARRCARSLLSLVGATVIVVTAPFQAGAVPATLDEPLAVLTDLETDTQAPLTETPLQSETVAPELPPVVAPDTDELATVDPAQPSSPVEGDGLVLDPDALPIEGQATLDPLSELNMMFQTLGAPVITEPHLMWQVDGPNGEPIGGASVDVSGPRTTGWFGWESWGSTTIVTDCVSETDDCSGTLDRDPRPGYFAISQKQVATGPSPIIQGGVYRIRASAGTAPPGYSWQSSTSSWTQIPANGNTATQVAWPSSSPGYTFPEGSLELTFAPSLTWEVTQGGVPVGGAIVNLQGPRASNNNWGRTAQVEDCTVAPCHQLSMDKDPRPGHFEVHTIRVIENNQFVTDPISRSDRYRISHYDAPVGYSWTGTSSREVPNNASWPVGTSYNLGELQLTQASTMSWDVKDAADNPVGGATVRVQGPATPGGNWGNNFYHVTDCTTGPCHPESMDQDPLPGKFKIDTLRGLANDGYTQTIVPVVSGSRYRIRPVGSIVGHTWITSTGADISIPGSGAGWIQGNYHFGDLQVASGRALSNLCTDPANDNSYYTLNRPNGMAAQIQKITHTADETSILSGSTNVPDSSLTSLASSGQTSNALGVTPTGIFYFTGQAAGSFDAQRNVTVFRFDPSVDSAPYPVTNMDMLSPGSGTVVSGAATIYQGNEEFYYAYYSDSPIQIDGRTAIRFHLYRYAHGDGPRTGEVRHIDVPRPPVFDGGMNGDFTFDAQNNLQFIISDFSGPTIAGTVSAADFIQLPSAHALQDVTDIQGTATSGSVSGGGVNGVVYTKNGRAILQQSASNRNRIVNLPGLDTVPGNGATRTFAGTLVDLASCASPMTVTIQKEVDGERFDPDDQFTLNASRVNGGVTNDFSPVTTTGTSSGVQYEKIGPFATTLAGRLQASESFVNADENNYKTSWRCEIQDAEGNPDGPAFATGEGASLDIALTGAGVSAQIKPGANIVCTFRNVALRSALAVDKVSDPSSGTPVDQDGIVKFSLDFDNTTGTSPAEINHRDHLRDVLDDAYFINDEDAEIDDPLITVEGGTNVEAVWAMPDAHIDITGTVPAGDQVSVSYRMKVKPNSDEATTRESSQASPRGYQLQNFLTTEGVDPPEDCRVDDDNPDVWCTTHPVNAWKVSKDSRPASLARLHAGGNAHYRLVAEKINPETVIDDLVFQDDLTNVFKTAGFAPDAPVPGGALSRGIYFFDELGNTLEGTNNATNNAATNGSPTDPQPAYTTTHVPEPVLSDGRWVLKSKPVPVPRNAQRVELWFAVEAGNNKTIPGSWPADTAPITGAKFTNFMTANATLAPNQCATVVTPDGNENINGLDPEYPAMCQVAHELQDNYFTIRKDAQGPGVDEVNLKDPGNVTEGVADTTYGTDVTGMWNMIGHEFEIRDDNSGAPSDYPSVQLCRTDYNPEGWTGAFNPVDPADPAAFDWEEDSVTLQAIKDWNIDNPDNQLPLCALLYEQGDINNLDNPANPGGQTGRWRSENLPTGNYWLVETKAPNAQINETGTQSRPVPGIQLLAEPIAFRVWPDDPNPDPPAGPSNQGLGQLDVNRNGNFDNWLDRCSPGAVAKDRPTACVNPTGYLLLVKDVTSISLPLTGGWWLGILSGTGLVILVLSGIGILWWRRRE